MKHLLLWDIDGTLIDSGGAGRRALECALRSEFAIDATLGDIEFAGRTDYWIARAALRKLGLPETEETFDRFFRGYLAALPRELANPLARVLPGVRTILDRLSAEGGVAQGLLTGNLARGAQLKLAHHRLWDHFAFGAFADDSEHRNELGPHAVRRACERHGVAFLAEHTWVIGDTVHDIACGNAIGARTLAVATGSADVATLRAAGATAVVADLSAADAVIRLLTS